MDVPKLIKLFNVHQIGKTMLIADTDEQLMSKWSDVQVGRWVKDIAKFSKPNSIRFRIFMVFFPNRIGFGSEFLSGLRSSFFYFRTKSNSVWKILSNLLRFVFRTKCLKCGCTPSLYIYCHRHLTQSNWLFIFGKCL